MGSVGLDPARLEPGRDLVIDPAPEHGLLLPTGVAVDDHLDPPARANADRVALDASRIWRAAHSETLTIDGVDLTWIWEVELLAECFLPAARLRAALNAIGPTEIEAAGSAAALLAAAEPIDAEVHAGATRGAPPPLAKAPAEALQRLVERTGVPPRPRGSVLVQSYWHLEPVWRRLVAQRGPWPVAGGVMVPGLSRSATLRAAWRGGWSGHPRAADHRRSAEQVMAAIASIEPRDRTADARATSVLLRRAGSTLARARHWRRVLRRGSVRLIVVPFDSPDEQRVVLAAGHAAGIPSLLVQHGFDAALNDPDKTVAGHVAVWSERDARAVAQRSPACIHTTGNPGAAHLVMGSEQREGARAVVLVEYPSRISAHIDARISLRHVNAALDMLERERPGSEAVIRPHPADRSADSYLAQCGARNLRVTVDAVTPIEALLGTASLCVGALSTATLQAGAIGIPTVFLDLTSAPRPWPFDGEPGGLERVVDEHAPLRPRLAVDAARTALGAREDAVENVAALITGLAAGG